MVLAVLLLVGALSLPETLLGLLLFILIVALAFAPTKLEVKGVLVGSQPSCC